jgi:glycine dehydrogenase
MGHEGLTRATSTAVLAANYVAAKLDAHFPVLYRGPGGLVAHECVLDVRPITKATGVTAEDIAKRLIDFGIHAPTMSFPVAGTLMVEPTESEDLAEIDRFIEAMTVIREEIAAIERGELAVEESPLRNAPHTAEMVISDSWSQKYGREQAAFPVPGLHRDKYFSPVRRIDNAYGDRNLMCACPPLEEYAE